MKVIGLLGGLGWETSAEYYRVINEEAAGRLGSRHSARCILYSVDSEIMERFRKHEDPDEVAPVLIAAARSLEKAGADLILVCSTTMHIVFDRIRAGVRVPLLHIVDTLEDEIKQTGLKTVGLLGTRQTMYGDFFKGRLERNGLRVLTPENGDGRLIDDIAANLPSTIRENPESGPEYRRIIADLARRGAQAVILGFMESGLPGRRSDDCPVPLIDAAGIHALKALEYAIMEPHTRSPFHRALEGFRRLFPGSAYRP